MIVELTNRSVEMSAIYEVEEIKTETYNGYQIFQFYFGNGKWSKEYREPRYTFSIIELKESEE